MKSNKKFYQKKIGQITTNDFPVLYVPINSLFLSVDPSNPLLNSKRFRVEVTEEATSERMIKKYKSYGREYKKVEINIPIYPSVVTLIDVKSKMKCVLQKCTIADSNPMKDFAKEEGLLPIEYTQPIIYRCIYLMDENGIQVNVSDMRAIYNWKGFLKDIFVTFTFQTEKNNTYVITGIER